MKMLGLYFSGTGNTRHCVEQFAASCDSGSTAISIERSDAVEMIGAHGTLIFGYPIYYSHAPKIVQDFIKRNADCFAGKQIFIIATMALFSGDGCGVTARLFQQCGATVIGGLHLKMPDSIGDEKALKRSREAKLKIISAADARINIAVHKLTSDNPPKDGLNFASHMAGLFGQRLWFRGKTNRYHSKPKIDLSKCSGCGICVKLCPMNNLSVDQNSAAAHERCTLCYRCFSHCPAQALTILGSRVHEQYLFDRVITPPK